MSPNEIQMICDRLDRIEDKLDENIRCQALKVPRSDCENHRKSLWETLNGVNRKVLMAAGALFALQIFIWPIVLWLITKG